MPKSSNAVRFFVLLALPLAGAVQAGEADVLDVEINQAADKTYRFDVTVRHTDQGSSHYADSWEVVAPDGEVLGTRTLYHPHVDQQPFTRSLSGVVIPKGIGAVTIRAHDSLHGYGGKEMTVKLPRLE